MNNFKNTLRNMLGLKPASLGSGLCSSNKGSYKDDEEYAAKGYSETPDYEEREEEDEC